MPRSSEVCYRRAIHTFYYKFYYFIDPDHQYLVSLAMFCYQVPVTRSVIVVSVAVN